jgi:heme exporter protein D
MTLIDRCIPLYVWFAAAFGMISMILGALNFGMLAVTLITVKGIYIPTWMIPVVATAIIVYCIIMGFVMERYDIMNRILDHQNRNQNPQMKQISDDVAEIKKMLEEK